MAAAAVAAELREDRHDLVGEVERQVLADRRFTASGTRAVLSPNVTTISVVPLALRHHPAGGQARRRLAVGDRELRVVT